MTPKVISTLPELVEAIRERRVELGLTFETLDNVTGLADGYCAKVLAPEPMKGLGPLSTPALLGGLAMRIIKVVVVEDAEQKLRMSGLWTKRLRPLRD